MSFVWIPTTAACFCIALHRHSPLGRGSCEDCSWEGEICKSHTHHPSSRLATNPTPDLFAFHDQPPTTNHQERDQTGSTEQSTASTSRDHLPPSCHDVPMLCPRRQHSRIHHEKRRKANQLVRLHGRLVLSRTRLHPCTCAFFLSCPIVIMPWQQQHHLDSPSVNVLILPFFCNRVLDREQRSHAAPSSHS